MTRRPVNWLEKIQDARLKRNRVVVKLRTIANLWLNIPSARPSVQCHLFPAIRRDLHGHRLGCICLPRTKPNKRSSHSRRHRICKYTRTKPQGAVADCQSGRGGRIAPNPNRKATAATGPAVARRSLPIVNHRRAAWPCPPTSKSPLDPVTYYIHYTLFTGSRAGTASALNSLKS